MYDLTFSAHIFTVGLALKTDKKNQSVKTCLYTAMCCIWLVKQIMLAWL